LTGRLIIAASSVLLTWSLDPKDCSIETSLNRPALTGNTNRPRHRASMAINQDQQEAPKMADQLLINDTGGQLHDFLRIPSDPNENLIGDVLYVTFLKILSETYIRCLLMNLHYDPSL